MPAPFLASRRLAPDGRHGWLNDDVCVGSLHTLGPKPNVLIRVYKLV